MPKASFTPAVVAALQWVSFRSSRHGFAFSPRAVFVSAACFITAVMSISIGWRLPMSRPVGWPIVVTKGLSIAFRVRVVTFSLEPTRPECIDAMTKSSWARRLSSKSIEPSPSMSHSQPVRIVISFSCWFSFLISLICFSSCFSESPFAIADVFEWSVIAIYS